MMTEKRDNLTEVLTPEEQQSVNEVLAKVEPLSPALKYAIASYFAFPLPEGEPYPDISVPAPAVNDADKKILREVVRDVIATMNQTQHDLLSYRLNEQLDELGFGVILADGPRQSVRIQE